MCAAKRFSAKKLMPLWIGLGVLAMVVSGVCIWLFGGGKYSGARLEEINNNEVIWTGSPNNNSPTNFFFYTKITLSDDDDSLLNPEIDVTSPFDEKDNSKVIWDETTSSYYQLGEGSSQGNNQNGGGAPGGGAPGGGAPGGGAPGGGAPGGGAPGGGAPGGGAPGGGGPGGGGPGGGGQSAKNSQKDKDVGMATDDNGTELTARIVEYDQNDNKICEVLVVNGKLHGPGFIWDHDGRLLHKAEFKNGKVSGTSTIKTYDNDGNEVYVRKLWWNDTPKLTTEQVYRNGKILWEMHWGGKGGKVSDLKRWSDVRIKKATDKDGGDIKTKEKRMKCIELLKTGRSYRKLKMDELNIFGLPKEIRTGFAELIEDTEDKKEYRTGVNPPTYGDIKKQIADTPWEKALLKKIEAMNVVDKDTPYEPDKDKDENGDDPGANGPGGFP